MTLIALDLNKVVSIYKVLDNNNRKNVQILIKTHTYKLNTNMLPHEPRVNVIPGFLSLAIGVEFHCIMIVFLSLRSACKFWPLNKCIEVSSFSAYKFQSV